MTFVTTGMNKAVEIQKKNKEKRMNNLFMESLQDLFLELELHSHRLAGKGKGGVSISFDFFTIW